MDLEKLKGKRTTARQAFTKLITKIESTIKMIVDETFTKEIKIEELYELKNLLIDRIDELKKLDNEIESLIEINELEKEYLSSDKYRESGVTTKTRIDRSLKQLEGNSDTVLKAESRKIDPEFNDIQGKYKKYDNHVIKLPRLNISVFNGTDCGDWLDFWNSYEVAIHNNDSLSEIEKFTYLKTYLKGNALTAVSGFSLSKENYEASIELLKERFGRTDLIISSHMNKLLLIEPVRTVANVAALRKMYDAIEVQVRSLESLGVSMGTYTSLLCPVILQKIPEEINLQYNRQRKLNELFDLKQLIDFLRTEIETRETTLSLGIQKKCSYDNPMHKPFYNNNNKNKFFSNTKLNKSTASALITNARNKLCIFCSKPHYSQNCTFNVEERKNALKGQGRCFLCFGRKHIVKQCWKRHLRCKICNSTKHGDLICQSQALEKADVCCSESSDAKEEIASERILLCKENKTKRQNFDSVYLQTFSALNFSQPGNKICLRGILDGGSTRSFILREIADSLKLKVVNKESLSIYPFGNKKSDRQNYDVVEILLCNKTDPKRKIKIQAIVIDLITLGKIEIPSNWIKNIAFEKGLELADYGTSDEIHLLIGSDYIWEVLRETNVRISKRLVATDSIFGFVIQGKSRETKESAGKINVNNLIVENDTFEFKRVSDLWQLEAIGINSDKERERGDTEVLETFERNTTYLNKRYETKLLWKDDHKQLKNNFNVARRRLFSLNNTFKRNETLYLRYRDIINEQLNENIIEYIDDNSYNNEHTGYFMPHHGVVRESKETTKVRICYDASSKAKDELSLNDCLDSGPNLNPDLLRIILKFRYHAIAFCADIQRAFLEISINEEDRKYLKFLWGDEKGTNLDLEGRAIRLLQMCRVPFGVTCSPFLLAATIKTHLKRYQNTYPDTCAILNELYVDDLINGSENVEQAYKITQSAVEIMSEASMNLRQWATNCTELQNFWKINGIECNLTNQESGTPLKVLGLHWDNYQDTIRVSLEVFDKFEFSIATKRKLLKACGMVFDPLGILAPFSIRIKLLIQSLWERRVSWDEPLPLEIEIQFKDWINEVKYTQDVTIPRYYFVHSRNFKNIELHLFSDASPRAYGSVGYFRIINEDGSAYTSFVIAKSRLAPIKKISLPRLELMAALISARLSSYLQQTFPILTANNIFFWCDSQITLHWINGDSKQWKLFVKNRVSEIQQKTNKNNWKFCRGKVNPADRLTRGVRINSLLNDEIWLNGPVWLSDREIVINEFLSDLNTEEVDDERKRVNIMLQTCHNSIKPFLDIERFSKLNRLLRTTAYVLRFINNARPNTEKRVGVITVEEILDSQKLWIKYIQQREFPNEYHQLQNELEISEQSILVGLNPNLADDGTLRLGGRLQHSEFQYQEKHPWILPHKSIFTDLLIMNAHETLCHAGVSETLTQIREHFWIIRGRQAVKSCLNKCLVCRRFKVKPGKQVVAPLPASRVCSEHPFQNVGVDFAGPLYTRDSNKVYIALFTCATTRAIHLELVSSLSTEHFLLAFRRFISRRGICSTVNSDNALTFKCADVNLKKLYSNIRDPNVQDYFTKKGISWHFIVERAAWWGGFWERMVRITKIALRKILGKSLVSYEELETILIEIEGIINSRPLTYVYNEPGEPFPLTPANFLIGKRLTFLPHWAGNATPDISSKRKILIKRFLYREKMLNEFWKRWKKEYLLQLKSVNFIDPVNVTTEFNVNDLVLIGEEKAPRNSWKLGKIRELYRGRDGKVRSVEVKTASGYIRRPIQLLYNLELN